MVEGAAEKIVNALTVALEKTGSAKFPGDIDFMYGLPDKLDNVQINKNEISIFLYDVHEDLTARHGEVRNYEAAKKQFSAGSVRLNYCFLITHWGPQQTAGVAAAQKAASLKIADFIVGRLINLRELRDIAGSYCRVLPPSEGLSSLGSFWQALGNRPRLCLGYMVTVPVKLDEPTESDVGMVRPF